MATGRDEMLKRNQQKTKKRKGLMQVLDDYRREEQQKKTYKPKNTPSLGEKAAKAKTNTKKAFSGKSLMPSGNNKTKIAFGGKSLMQTDPVKPIGGGGGTRTRPMPPSEQANKGYGKDGKFGTGTYGSGRPSGGRGKRPVRSDFPTGAKGAQAFAAALKKYGGAAPRPTESSAVGSKGKVKRNRRGRVVK